MKGAVGASEIMAGSPAWAWPCLSGPQFPVRTRNTSRNQAQVSPASHHQGVAGSGYAVGARVTFD